MKKVLPTPILLILQMILTIGIIIYVPNSILQTILLLSLWIYTFYPVSRFEIVTFVITCIFFTLGDVLVVSRNIFEFTHVDIWGLPYYEPFVWGFYFLHSMRMIKIMPTQKIYGGVLFGIIYVLILSFIKEETLLLYAIAFLLFGALAIFRTKGDFLYTGYLILIGLIIEYIGVYSGIWYYNIEHYVLWWVLTWGAAGLILYRAILPISVLASNRLNTKK